MYRCQQHVLCRDEHDDSMIASRGCRLFEITAGHAAAACSVTVSQDPLDRLVFGSQPYDNII
jgi:PIN domain nuclease of toxin-antitoxin system